MLDRLIIIGTGLMGASLGARVKARGLAARVVGVDGGPSKEAQRLGCIDEAFENIAKLLGDEGNSSGSGRLGNTGHSGSAGNLSSTGIVIATPVTAIAKIFREIEPLARESSVVWITDLCSTKADVIRAADSVSGFGGKFVSSHPMAGSEKQGAANADASIYDEARVLISPVQNSSQEALADIERFWTALGLRPASIPAEDHDALLASISHLPHIVAYSLAATLADSSLAASAQALHGGGLRDTTRIAASSPELWADIFLANREELLSAWSQWLIHQQLLKDALANQDRTMLVELLDRAAHWRKGF